MCRCWTLDPVDRPSFSKLVAFMEKELAALEERVTFMWKLFLKYGNIAGGYTFTVTSVYSYITILEDPATMK